MSETLTPAMLEEEKRRAFLSQGIPAGAESAGEDSVKLDSLTPEYDICPSDHISDSEEFEGGR